MRTGERAVEGEAVDVPQLDALVGAGRRQLAHVRAEQALEHDRARVRAQLVQRLEVRRQARAAHHAPHVARACGGGAAHMMLVRGRAFYLFQNLQKRVCYWVQRGLQRFSGRMVRCGSVFQHLCPGLVTS